MFDVDRMLEHIAARVGSARFAPASADAVRASENRLGVQLPTLLRRCLMEIGNGGFGPGHGLLGVSGGFSEDLGTLAEASFAMRDTSGSSPGGTGVCVPFCEFGCGIYYCLHSPVDEAALSIHEDGQLWPQIVTLERLFEMWLAGEDVLNVGEFDLIELEGINPFTQRACVYRRRRRVR